MELGIILTAIAIAVLVLRHAVKTIPLAATKDDWFVVFDINAELKVLCLWFYPIVGFDRSENQTIAITSRPDYTRKLAASRPAKKVNESCWGISISYGRWLRDGTHFDEWGNPEYSDSSDFSTTIEMYLLGEFKLCYKTPVPIFYQNEIKNAVERARNFELGHANPVDMRAEREPK